MTELNLSNFDSVVDDEEKFDGDEYEAYIRRCITEHKFVNFDYGLAGNNVLVGHEFVRKTVSCDHFKGWRYCPDKEAHELPLMLQNKPSKNQVFVKPVFYHCFNWGCWTCLETTVYREASNVEGRLRHYEEIGKKVEHVIASVPVELYGLAFEGLGGKRFKKVLRDVLIRHGVEGGCIIPHAFRQEKVNGVGTGYWRFSPHYHILGAVMGGYGLCRACVDNPSMRVGASCGLHCDGFERRTRDSFYVDGWVVKIAQDFETGRAEERKSIFYTVAYQLSHASYDRGRKRAGVVSWFGTCSYRRMKFKFVRKKCHCPLCGGELVKGRYDGDKVFCLDRDSDLFRPSFVTDSDGWSVVESVWRSGAYE